MEREIYYNLTRNGDNIEINKEKDLQKARFSDYIRTNHYANKSGMKDVINLATGSPNVFYSGPNGDLNTVDDESKLFIGTTQTNMKCKLNLQQRQYLTVPYLGRGVSKPLLESKLQQGTGLEPKKSCKTITEKSFGREKTYLVDPLQKTVQNPKNLIEDSAHEGWIRGGLPSRQLAIETALRKE